MIPRSIQQRSSRWLSGLFTVGCLAIPAASQAQTVGGAQPSTTPAQVAPSGPATASPPAQPVNPAVPPTVVPPGPTDVRPGAAQQPGARRPGAANTNPSGRPGAAGTVPAQRRPSAAPTDAATQQAIEGLKQRSATANVVFGQIASIDDKRLNIRDGETLTGLNITPRTIVSVNGKIGKVSDLNDLVGAAQVQVFRDPKNPSRVLRVVVDNNLPVVNPGEAATATPSNLVGDNAAGVPSTSQGQGLGARSQQRSTATRQRRPSGTQSNGAGIGRTIRPSAALPGGRATGVVDEEATERAREALREPIARPELRSQEIGSNNPARGANAAGGASDSRIRNDVGGTTGVNERPFQPGQNPGEEPLAPFAQGNEQPLAPGTRDQRPLAPGTSGETPTQVLSTAAAAPIDLGAGLVVGNGGISVGGVVPTGIVGTAGLIAGDTITSVGGQAVATPADLFRVLNTHAAGDRVVAEVMREGTPHKMTLTLPQDFTPTGSVEAEPELKPSLANVDTRMFTPVDLGWGLKKTPEGVLVLELQAGGPAATGKIEAGDLITTVGGRPVTSPGAVSYELHRHKAGESVELGILRDGQKKTETVKLPANHEALLTEDQQPLRAPQADSSAEIQQLRQEIDLLRQELQQLRGGQR